MPNETPNVLGGAPMTDEFLSNLNRQASSMPPAGAVDVPVRFNGEDVTVPVSLAREALYRHMNDLRRKIDGAANMPDPYRFAGNGNVYLEDVRRGYGVYAEMISDEAEQARAELERLEKLTDSDVVSWAIDTGKIRRSLETGGLVIH